jgi:hypothetical protein
MNKELDIIETNDVDKVNIDDLREIIVDFDTDLNQPNKTVKSVLQKKVASLDRILDVTIKPNIRFSALYNNEQEPVVSAVLSVVNLFSCSKCDTTKTNVCDVNNLPLSACGCCVFSKPSFACSNTDSLHIYACFDDCERIIEPELVSTSDWKTIATNSRGMTVSGVTYPGYSKIVLTKTEEIVKLLIHELVHYYRLDSILHRIPVKQWSVDHPLNPGEAYAECLSVIIHSVIFGILVAKKQNLNPEEKITLIRNIIDAEINYSINLSATILRVYSYTSNNLTDFFHLSSSSKRQTCPIAIWEYVLMRTSLLININHLIDLVPDFQVTKSNANEIISMCNDRRLEGVIRPIIDTIILSPEVNISYLLHDVNWSKL